MTSVGWQICFLEAWLENSMQASVQAQAPLQITAGRSIYASYSHSAFRAVVRHFGSQYPK